MGKKDTTSIDSLFGSKTRVKLLHLFLNNPGKAFYVREITRLIDEQINSVRRELSNMLRVGVIVSDTAENKLFYQVNNKYEFYSAFAQIFADSKRAPQRASRAAEKSNWLSEIKSLKGQRLVVIAGRLVEGSASPVDVLFVGSTSAKKIKDVVANIETEERADINYSAMSYDEFYYRWSVRDRFITEIIAGKYTVVVDTDNMLGKQ